MARERRKIVGRHEKYGTVVYMIYYYGIVNVKNSQVLRTYLRASTFLSQSVSSAGFFLLTACRVTS